MCLCVRMYVCAYVYMSVLCVYVCIYITYVQMRMFCMYIHVCISLLPNAQTIKRLMKSNKNVKTLTEKKSFFLNKTSASQGVFHKIVHLIP